MAREFWEVFLPKDITVFGSKWDGRNNLATITFSYPGSTRRFTARFCAIINAPNQQKDWVLDEIVEI